MVHQLEEHTAAVGSFKYRYNKIYCNGTEQEPVSGYTRLHFLFDIQTLLWRLQAH